MRVVFLEEAEEEVREAAAYYRDKVAGLGREFRHQVQRTICRIRRFPHSGTLVATNLRRHLVRHFPFAILYRVDPDKIAVLAVMHLRRRPDYWEGRL